MKKLILLLMVSIPLILNAQFFVAVDGDDNNTGTSTTEPWATWNKGFRNAEPGDTVYLRGGVYYSTERIGMQGWTCPRWFYGAIDNPISPSGTQDSGVVIMGYPADIEVGNYPILDCSQHCQNMHLTGYNYFEYKRNKSPYNPKYNSAITLVDVENVTLKDFKIRNVYQCDGVLQGALTVIGRNITYDNISIEDASLGFWHISTSYTEEDSAYIKDMQLWTGSREHHALMTIVQSRTTNRPLTGSDTLLNAFWEDTVHYRPPDTSRWINCDVSNICDTLSFTRHDLYHYTIFEGDTLYSMRLYNHFNDFITPDTGIYGDAWKVQSFNGNYYSFEGCRAWNYAADGFDVRGGKILFKDCWVMPTSKYEHFNKSDGFVTSGLNSNLLSYYDSTYRDQLLQDTLVRFENCLAMYCTGKGFKYGMGADVGNNPIFYNNTSYGNHIAFSSEISSQDTIGIYHNNIAFNSDTNINILSNYYGSHNSWDSNIVVTDNDFVTVDSSQLIALFIAPRDSNFNLPDTLPLMLSNTSSLIDSGLYVGINYNGTAPDIGYSESDYQYDEIMQNISLSVGWNIASFYVQPDTTNILNVVSPLIEDSTLVKIMDEAGNLVQNIEPYGWLNTIGDIENTEGYYINVNDSTSFNVKGTQVVLPYHVDLQAGWNILGYPLDVNQDAISILQPLIDDNTLMKVQDESGGIIQNLPDIGWVNTIIDFKPGEGYLINVSDDNTLTYSPTILKSTLFIKDIMLTESICFTELQGNPFMAMNILIENVKAILFDVEEGDELAAYDGDILVGSTILDISNYFPFSIVARANDPTTQIQDGFIDGNPIIFKYCDVSKNRIYEMVRIRHTWGDEHYTSLGTKICDIRVKAKKITDKDLLINDTEIFLEQNYPNPFTDHTTIEYGISEDGYVLLKVIDMSGRIIILENSYKISGLYSIEYNSNLKPGLYFYQLDFVGDDGTMFRETKKMIISR